MNNNKLIALAASFASFFIEQANLTTTRSIILFGSVARQEASKESDVDIFIDVSLDKEKAEKEAKEILQKFLNSKHYRDYWLLKGITNEIKLNIGPLNDWKGLKESILANGIKLYGKYEELPDNAVNKTLLFWEAVKPESKRVLLSKRLFGYSHEGKRYPGMVQKYNAEKMGKGIISVGSQYTNLFIKLFREMKISVKIRKVIEYKK